MLMAPDTETTQTETKNKFTGISVKRRPEKKQKYDYGTY